MTPAERTASAGVFYFDAVAESVDLKEYLRKHDYRFAHEPYRPEGDSWIRVIALFVGGIPRDLPTRDAASRAGR
jgi:hypothetical protein